MKTTHRFFYATAIGKRLNRVKLVVPLVGLLLGDGIVFGQAASNFTPLGGGTFSWGDAANWSAGIPNADNAAAAMNFDITGDTVLNLNGSRTLRALTMGDTNGSHTQTIAAGTGGTLTLSNSLGDAGLTKVGGATDTISAALLVRDRTTIAINAGTLIMSGSVTVGGSTEPGLQNTFEKTGNGTLTVSGNFTLNGPGIGGNEHLGMFIVAGTTNLTGLNNTISNGIRVQGGVINLGGTSGTSTTMFTGVNGGINVSGGTFNIGVATPTGQSAPVNNATIPLDQITMTGGVLNLRNGSGLGTTTLTMGTTGTMTLEGGTTTFANTGGTAGGTVVIPVGAKLALNENATLNFTSTANANYTFATMSSNSTTSILRSQAGNATFTLGGDGIDDFFNGQINFASSGADSRIIKIGSETFTIGGNRDNPTARLDVQQGTVILAKESAGLVHAIGGNMIIGNATAGEKVVVVGGTFLGEGVNLPANFNDQIFRTSVVTINEDGVLDLNGFTEGLDYLLGTGLVTNRAAATSATLILGDNNFGGAGRTFDGTIQDGAGQIGLIKTGDQTLSLTNGGSSYTGSTVVGKATLQLLNAGALTGTSAIRVERAGTLLINNAAQTVQNRINDLADIRLDRGTLILRGSLTENQSIVEKMGTLSFSGFNIVRTDTSGNGGTGYVNGSSLTINFAAYNRLPGGQVAFVEQSSSTSAGFLAGSPAASTSKIILDAMPTSFLVGGGSAGFDPNRSILVGAFGGIRANASTEFMTVQNLGGNIFVRPLNASEMNTVFTGQTLNISNLPGGPSTTWSNTIMLNAGTLRINANTAFNAVRFNGASNIFIAEDRKWVLGGMEANSNLGSPTFDGSGMLAFVTGAVNTYGGTISFGNREAILRAGGSTHAFRSVIEGTGGLSKSGGTRVDLMGSNTYSGRTWLSEGELRAFTDQGFGAMGVGNEVINTLSTLSMQSGINVGDGTLLGSKDLYLVGAGAVLSSIDQNNVWGGGIRVNPSNSGGQSGQNVTIRATGNSILTVKGMVTGAAENVELNLHEVSATQNFTGSGNGIILENNVGGTGGSVIFLKGGVADREGEAAAGTGVLPAVGVPARAAEHEKLNLFVRGFTGQSNPTNSDFVVNISDATKVNGRIDLRSGSLFIDSDYGTGGKGDYVRGALIRLSDGGNVDRAGIMAGLIMTQPNTIFRGNDIQIGVNDGSHSSNSMALIGGINRSGKVIIGSDRGTLDMNPVAGNSQFTSASTVQANAGVTTIALPTGSVKAGYGISGTGIAPGTFVTSVSNGLVTLSQATTAVAGVGTSYTLGFFPSVTNVTGTTTNEATNPTANETITVSSTTGFAVGRGISGPGIPVSTTITGINGNVLTLSNRTTAAGAAGSTYSAYNLALGNSITVGGNLAGLRVGMGIVGTGITPGTTITAISGNVMTLSAPLSNAMPLGTSLAFPLARVSYQTITTNGGTNGFNSVGSNKVRIFNANGLVVGTTVSGRGVPGGTTLTNIQSISPGVWELTLSQNLIEVENVAINGVSANIGLTIQKAANFAETRMYAAPGGTVDFRMRVIDDGGFSLQNEVGAVTKVGRGTVEMSGSAAGASDYDGGLNLFGGTLVFDYINLQTTEDLDILLLRDNSRISGGANNVNPFQLTLGGGNLLFRDGDSAGITENIRGTLTVRAGNSQIIGQAGNGSALTLNLGYHNPFVGESSSHYWRAPDRFAGGTMQIEYGNLIDPEDPLPFGGTVRVQYSQNAPSFANFDGKLGSDSIIPYATMKINDPFLGAVVDFASFYSELQTNGQSTTLFADSSGFIGSDLYDPYLQGSGTELSSWDYLTNSGLNYGYMSDDSVDQFVGTGWQGTLQPNTDSNQFRGARVLRFISNKAENALNLGGTRLVLGTANPLDPGLEGSAVQDGGAILISNLVSNNGAKNQFIRGGSLTSATPSLYFSADVMVGPYSKQATPAATSTDLIIHNYNELGVFTIESPMVNFGSLPMNLVVSGPGTTKLQPSTTNTFSGAVFINDGTLWVNSQVALGASPTSMIYFNGGTLEIAALTEANRNSEGLTRTLVAGRPIVIGGNGATIKTSAPGTVVTYAGVIRAEDNIIPLNLLENQYQENMGVGDVLKTGAGRLIITNAKTVGADGWNAYFGVTEVLGGTLQVNINAVNSGILGSHYSFLDGTRIESGARLDLQILGETLGTAEWFDLLGGTLGTTPLHTDGVLDGMIRFSANSIIDVTQGNLRLNVNAGTVDGAGKLTKTGQGMLMFYENSNHTGEIEIVSGSILGRSQGLPFGSGTAITMGDNTANASGTAGIYLGSRTTEANFRTTYEVAQNITVRAEGGVTQQAKYLGAINGVGFGAQNDTYLFSGNIGLFDDLILSYTDEAANVLLNPSSSTDGLRGGNRTIALRGNLTGAGNLQTEVIQMGGTVNGADPDQLIAFELGGDNSGWSGSVRVGNSSLDNDRQHILRVTNAQGLGAANNVTMDFNSSFQVGGHTLNIGNLDASLPIGSAVTNGVYVENAANGVGTLVVNQTVDRNWNAIFRNGVTPGQYGAFDAPIRDNVLNLVKTGPATATMTQVNTYTGFTHVGTANGASGGTLRIGAGGAIAQTSALTIFAGTFQLAGANLTTNQVVTLGGGAAGTRAVIDTGSNTMTLGAAANVVYNASNNPAGAEIRGNLNMGTGTRTFTVADSIGAAIDLEVTAVLSGTAGLTKNGLGRMSLGGASSYSGLTTVSSGGLYAMNTTGSATGTGNVLVSPGATFGGVGTIAGDVTLSSGSLGNHAFFDVGSPLISSGVELLTLNQTLTLGEFAIVDFYLGQTGFSKLDLNLIAVAPTVKFRINLESGYVPAAGSSFDVLDWLGTVSGSFTNWESLLELPAGSTSWLTNQFNSDGIIRVAGTPEPAAFLSQPQGLTLDPGQTASFTVALMGAEPLLCQWTKNGVDIPGATGRTFTIQSVVEADEGEYRVRVNNGFDPILSNPAVLIVNDVPLIVTAPVGGEINPGSNFSLVVIATNATTFEWRRNNVPVVGGVVNDTVPAGSRSTLTITNATEANEGTYTVVVGNPAGSIVGGPVDLIVRDPVVITAQPVNRSVPQGTVVQFAVTATGHPTLNYQWKRGATNVGTNSPTLQVTAGPTTWGNYTVSVTNAFSSQVSSVATLAEVDSAVAISLQPAPQIAAVGSTVTLTCAAVGGLPIRYQWRRNGVNIAGATSPTLVLSNVTTARAGSYTCFVSNRLASGNTTALSDAADVAIVSTAPRTIVQNEGTTATLSVAHGGNVAFQWFRLLDVEEGEGDEEEEVSGPEQVIAGAVFSTLSLPNVSLSDSGTYFCRVTGTGGVLDGGLNELIVFNAAPVFAITSGSPLPETVISEDYSYQVPMDPDSAKTATKFVASGLPPGLKIGNDGVISGRATATRFPTPYVINITASNARGAATVVNLTMLVKPLPGALIGTFTGLVARDPGLNVDLGGRIDLKTTVKGTFSGKILLGTRTHSFKGVLNTDVDNEDVATCTTEIRRGKLVPLVVSFTLDASTNLLTAGSVTDGVSIASFNGWRSKWPKAVKGQPAPAAAVAGYYTTGLQFPGGGFILFPEIPQGTGYATFTVNANTARLKVVGRLPDGTAFTSATFVGPTGQVLVFRTLYAANARGSVIGTLQIQEAFPNKENTLIGGLNWWRPATPAASARLYKAGFGPIDIDAGGGRYDPPQAGQIVMEINPILAPFNASISFFEAKVESAEPAPNSVEMAVAPTHKVLMNPNNPRRITLRIVPRTGLLSGRFVLSTDHPDLINGGRPARITRTVNYLGAIIKNGGAEEGMGYFLLPDLPTIAAEPANRTAIFSGQMVFQKLPLP